MGTSLPAAENPIRAQMRRFSAAYGKQLSVVGLQWRYYRLGDGPTVVWLTGGLRRAAFGFGFLQLLARAALSWRRTTRVKRLLAGGLAKVLTTDPKHEDWRAAVREILERDLTRADVVSHFAVVADIIKTRLVRPGAFHAWNGRAVVLRADNDPTQGRWDLPRYERLFGRHVEAISMGQAGHTAAIFDPPQYVGWLRQALA